MKSSAYIRVKAYDYRYWFTGVTSVKHSFSLQVASTYDASRETGFVNGAKNQPNKVTLSVVETDTGQSGRSAGMIRALESVKQSRALCQVYTAARSYDNMLLTDISATQDETNPTGWTGTLTFTQAQYVTWNPDYHAPAAGTDTNSNSSTVTNTGSAAAKTVPDSAAAQTLSKAGIK